MSQDNDLLKAVENYYSDKIKEYGISAKGVDWNSETSQQLRFDILLKVLREDHFFSILDYGCGYGALLDFLESRYDTFEYTGFDISEGMLEKAIEKNKGLQSVKWVSSLDEDLYDYTVASGIFNVKLNQPESTWKEYIERTLFQIDKRSQKGFSFNMLTGYSDKEYMKDYLFYADPGYYFDFCKKHFSKYVSLLHDYPLYEFSIIVRK